jgi:GNAT superfamily N-acetyltransferase
LETKIDIHKADDREKELLIGIWLERAAFLEKKGKPMWEKGQFTVEGLDRKYGNPEYYIGFINGKPFGGFLLLEYDARYWPGKRDRAYYFHKFVVAEEFAGQGLAKAILNWVKAFAAEKGKSYVRLDFEEKREYLKTLYYGTGFKKAGTVENETGDMITLAECAV